MIDKPTKKQYIQKLAIGYYCQKIYKYSKKCQNSNTVGAKICRK